MYLINAKTSKPIEKGGGDKDARMKDRGRAQERNKDIRRVKKYYIYFIFVRLTSCSILRFA